MNYRISAKGLARSGEAKLVTCDPDLMTPNSSGKFSMWHKVGTIRSGLVDGMSFEGRHLSPHHRPPCINIVVARASRLDAENGLLHDVHLERW